MIKRPIASQSLEQYSDYMLDKMWRNGDIDKCPVCKRYHDKNGMTKFIQNMTKCDECKQGLDLSILDEWKKEKVNDKGIK